METPGTTGIGGRRRSMRRPLVPVMVAALWVLALAGVASAQQPQWVTAQDLATIGLADLQERKVLEVCVPADAGLAGKKLRIDITFSFTIALEPELHDEGEYIIEDLEVVREPQTRMCISNLDVDIDVTSGTVDYEALEDKLEQFEIQGGEGRWVSEPPNVEMPDAQGVLQGIYDAGGLLPEFEITLGFDIYLLTEDGGWEEKPDYHGSVTLVNTNPPPLEFLAPSMGDAVEQVRPEFQFAMPSVPAGIDYLDLELSLDDLSTGQRAWRSPVTLRLAPPPAATMRLPYPAGELDLIPGHAYRARAILTDPAGKVVGVGADPQGEDVEFSVAVEALEPLEPEDGAVLRELYPALAWDDLNPQGVRDGFAAYRVQVSERQGLDGAVSADEGGLSHTYRNALRPLRPGSTYYWRVVPVDRQGRPIEAAASLVRSFTLEPIPVPVIVSPRPGASMNGGIPVLLWVEQLPEWSPALEVEWYVDGRLATTGETAEVELPPGQHRVFAEVSLPGLPGMRERSEEVEFSVPGAGAPVAYDLAPLVSLSQGGSYRPGDEVPVEVHFLPVGTVPYEVRLYDGERLVAVRADVQASPVTIRLRAAEADGEGVLGTGTHSLVAEVRDAAGGAGRSEERGPGLTTLTVQTGPLEAPEAETALALTILEPRDGTYLEGQAVAFVAEAIDSAGNDLGDQLTWEVRGPSGTITHTGNAFRLEPAPGAYVATAWVSVEGRRHEASVSFDVAGQEQPTLAVVAAVYPRGSLTRRVAEGVEEQVRAGAILAEGALVVANGNPGVPAGTEVGQLMAVARVSVTERAAVAGGGSGKTTTYAPGGRIPLRAGYAYELVVP